MHHSDPSFSLQAISDIRKIQFNDMGPVGLQAIQTGGNALDSILNFFLGKKRDERQLKHSKELSAYEFDKNMEAWRIQNAYNAPSQQMQRFREAGLNPNLIYGKGTPGNATELPKYQAPRPNYRYNLGPMMQGVLANYNSTLKNNAEVDLLRKNRDLQDEKILTESVNRGLTAAQTLKADADTKNRRILNSYQADLLKQQLVNSRTKVSEMVSNTQVNYARKELLKAQTASEMERPAQVRATVRQIQANTSLSRKQIEKLNSDIRTAVIAREKLRNDVKRGKVDLSINEYNEIQKMVETGWLLDKGIRPQDSWMSKEARALTYDAAINLKRTGKRMWNKTKAIFKRDWQRLKR